MDDGSPVHAPLCARRQDGTAAAATAAAAAAGGGERQYPEDETESSHAVAPDRARSCKEQQSPPFANPADRTATRRMSVAAAKLLQRRKAVAAAQVVFMPAARSNSLRHLVTLTALCASAFVAAPLGAGAAPAVPAAAAAADETSAYATAQVLFHDRKFKEAIVLLDPYVAAHPRDARALVLRGDCKADLGDNEGALKDYNSAIKIEPEYEYAYVTRCETRLVLDDTAGALRDCDTAVRLDATDALAFEDRADVQFQREAYDLALSDYDKAVELGRSSAYVFAARCDTERLVGKLDRAKTDCEKALGIDPKSRRGLWARGRLALAQTRYTDGIADLNAYIALDPKASDVGYYFRGLAYNRIQSYSLALEDLQTYVRRHPVDPDGYKERAVARYWSNDKDGALADLATALRGYRKDGNTAAADRVSAMIEAVRTGKPPAP